MKNKSLVVILILALITLIATGTITVISVQSGRESFHADGYILNPSKEEYLTSDVNEQVYFNAGTKYSEKYGSNVIFKDTNGNKVTLPKEEFIHYLDGSLGALTKGVLMEANQNLTEEQVTYFNVAKSTTLVSNGTSYSMATLDSEMNMTRFVWKLSDTTYMVVAPEVILHISDEAQVSFEGYAQIEYVKEGIVRIIHQQGTYQTVSSEAYLDLGDGITMNLSGRKMLVDGEEGVDLASMILGAEDNVTLAGNEDEFQIPTFNVVNGANGANGADGADGENGEDGTNGDNGTDGADATAGKIGNNGTQGEDGMKGEEGDTGTLGYDGKPGSDGVDAENSDPTGVVAVEQLPIPTISLDTNTYDVGINRLNMDLKITDKSALLQNDLEYEIRNAATNEVVSKEALNANAASVNINTKALSPNTEYVVIVSGSYSPDGTTNTLEGQFFIKQFKTDDAGITLSKLSVTDNSAQFRVTLDPVSKPELYSLCYTYYDEAGVLQQPIEIQSNISTADTTPKDFILSNLSSDTEYKIYVSNMQVKDNAGVSSVVSSTNIELPCKTLKKTPYYEYSVTEENVPVVKTSKVSEVKSTVSLNARDKTLSLSMPSLVDENKGIVGYRYELYETNSTGILGEPILSTQSEGLMIQSFDLEADKTYTGRVVVLFDDNEKVVELPTQAPQTVGLPNGTFPVVTYHCEETQQEKLRLKVMISDPSGMLIGNVGADYPINITFSNTYGDSKYLEIKELTTVDATNAVFYISQDGLRKDTVYTVSMTGPVNTTGTKWKEEGGLSAEQRDAMKDTYLSGVQYDTKQSAIVDPLFFDISSTSALAFAVGINTRMYRASEQQAGDPQYVAADNTEYNTNYVLNTVNKMTFELSESATGNVLGTGVVYDLEKASVNHESEFYSCGYSADGVVSNPVTTQNLILTPDNFNVSDSQLTPGQKYTIKLVEVEDYVGNKLDYVYSNASYEVELKDKHLMAGKPYEQIQIVEIKNKDVAGTTKYNEDLGDDTIIGVRLIPSYALGDVLKISYTAYKAEDADKAPETEDMITLANYASTYGSIELGTKEFNFGNTNAAKIGQSFIGDNQQWCIYFDEVTVLNKGGTSANVTFRRGEQYYFRYEVETSKENGANCHGVVQNDIYPYCVYETATLAEVKITDRNQVPFYRSPLYSAIMMKPTVERYPADSTANSVTWNYRIYDPDGAVEKAGNAQSLFAVIYNASATAEQIAKDENGDGVVYLDTANTIYYDESQPGLSAKTIGVKSMLPGIVVTNKNAGFAPVILNGLTDGRYYRIGMEYKLGDTAANESIVSNAIVFQAVSAPSTDLSLGSVEDFGGGELRITLLGEGVAKYSALKVTVSNGGVDKIYDPVYFEIQSGTFNSQRYAYAYLDYEPLKDWQKQNVSIKIEGYYNTAQFGLSDFKDAAKLTPNGNFVDTNETIYSLYNMSSSLYSTYDSSHNVANITNGVVPSCFKAGETDTNLAIDPVTGMEMPVTVPAFIASENAQLRLQYAFQPLITASAEDLTEIDRNIAFDENGMFMLEGNLKKYYSLQKLVLANIGTDPDFYLEELLPTVHMDSLSAGVKTTAFTFKVTGNVKADTKIFVELYDTDTNTVKALDMTAATNTGKHYATPGTISGVPNGKLYYDYSASGNFNHPYTTQAFPIDYDATTKTGTYSVILTGLDASTVTTAQRYGFKLYVQKEGVNETFTDNGSGNILTAPKRFYLYDTEYKQSGKLYEFNTGTNVAISLKESGYTYTNYQNKSGSFDYKVEGAGMGYRLQYSLSQQEGAALIGYTDLPKKGTIAQYQYYDNVFGSNTPIGISMNPQDGILSPGTAYILSVRAIDETDGDVIGTSSLTFTTKTFSMPTTKYSVVSGTDSLQIQYTLSDPFRVIYNTASIQTAGPYQVEISYTDAQGNKQIAQNYSNYFGNQNLIVNGLNQNTQYTITVTAQVDRDNDYVKDEDDFIDIFTGTTKSTTEASVTSYTDIGNNLVLSLENVSNFEAVQSVKYTYYDPNGGSIGSGTADRTQLLGSVTGGYIYTSALKASQIGMHYVSVQFYDANGSLIGNVLDNQFMVSSIQ